MKSILRLITVGAVLAPVFLACQSDVTEPTEVTLNEDWEYPAIWGYCLDDEGKPIYMAQVRWSSPAGEVGYCVSRIDGRYRITDFTEAWVIHDGEDLDGEAHHDLYNSAYAYIEDFEYTETYRRDFEMDPDPGHEQPLETNGIFDNAYVRDAVTGAGIYPATVAAVGWNADLLGIDTT